MPDAVDEHERRRDTLAALTAHRASRSVMPVALEARLANFYLKTNRDTMLIDQIDEGLDRLALTMADGTRHEGRGLAILGGSGSGKSRSIQRTLSRHPLFPGFAAGEPDCIAVSVRCKGSYTLKMLGIEISKAVGYPLAITQDENVVWARVRQKIAERAVVLLHIDEVNSLLRKTTTVERDRIVDQFKSLQNDKDWPIFLILSGTPRCRAYLTGNDPDGELERRIDWRTYAKLRLPHDIKKIASHIVGLCKIAEIGSCDSLESAIVPRLIHAGRYELGSSIEIAVGAVKLAWESGKETLGFTHFAQVLSKKCPSTMNPFIASEWWNTKVMARDEDDDDDDERRKKKERARQ